MSNPIDTYTETTTQSWGNRLLGALLFTVLGPLLVVGSCVALFWNEGRAVQTERSLAEGAAIVIEVASSPVSPDNEGKLVHVTGDLKAVAKLADQEFGVVSDAARLKRFVSMYQWTEESKSETRKTAGGAEETVTTYIYKKEWSGKAIDSSRFKQPGLHENPPMRYADRDLLAGDATLGAFRTGAPVLNAFKLDTDLKVDPAAAETVRKNTGKAASVAYGKIYISENPGSPDIGDYRISYRIVPAGPASVVARQNGSELTGYQSQAGDVILLAHTGNVSAADMFKAAQKENRILTWILRAVFTFLMFVGFVLSTSLIVKLADFFPFLGNLVQATMFAAAFVLTAIVAPFTIAFAWLFFRPMISLTAAAIGVALAYTTLKLMEARKTREARPAEELPGQAPR